LAGAVREAEVALQAFRDARDPAARRRAAAALHQATANLEKHLNADGVVQERLGQ
jgi:hypothetical protein